MLNEDQQIIKVHTGTAEGAPAQCYGESLGIMLGLSKLFGETRPHAQAVNDVLVTVYLRRGDGQEAHPLILRRRLNDIFVKPTPTSPDDTRVASALIKGKDVAIEAFAPHIPEGFAGLATLAAILGDMDVELRCEKNPPLVFAFCRRGAIVLLDTRPAKPRITI